jgi:hypothetical protein
MHYGRVVLSASADPEDPHVEFYPDEVCNEARVIILLAGVAADEYLARLERRRFGLAQRLQTDSADRDALKSLGIGIRDVHRELARLLTELHWLAISSFAAHLLDRGATDKPWKDYGGPMT